MHLSSLWAPFKSRMMDPADFARRLNDELCKVVRDESFATAICGLVDAHGRSIWFASAGGPPIVVFKADGEARHVVASGLPLGMIADADYEEQEIVCDEGDCVLLFTDGAVEIHAGDGRMLGTGGLIDILHGLDYPAKLLAIEPLQEALLRYSDGLRLADDPTFMEIRFPNSDA